MISAAAGWAHYPCFAHTIHLVMKDFIKAHPELLDMQQRCSAIVTFFHHSTNATENPEKTEVSRTQAHTVSLN